MSFLMKSICKCSVYLYNYHIYVVTPDDMVCHLVNGVKLACITSSPVISALLTCTVYKTNWYRRTEQTLTTYSSVLRMWFVCSCECTQVNKDPNLLPDVNLVLKWNDTRGDTVVATHAITEMICDGVVAFFGPEGTCFVEATVAQSRNIPMISYVSIVHL